MKIPNLIIIILLLTISCKPKVQSNKLVSKYDDKLGKYAYYDVDDKKIVGDYYMVYTDTLSDYAVVADPDFVLIDRTGKHVYTIFPFDNGPDYTSEGIYRIVKDGKIGYADSLSSKIIIEPKFDCAYPFENGKAKVSINCKTVSLFQDDEHKTWKSDNWFYIDRNGNVLK